MSRINLGIEPWRLTNEHLLAEHREIKRICNVFEKIKNSNRKVKIPNNFCLGSGHVMYFVYKPDTTYFRYIQLYEECINRGFNIEDYRHNWDIYSRIFDKSKVIQHTSESIELLKERISTRLMFSKKSKWHYTKNMKTYNISYETSINLLDALDIDDIKIQLDVS